MKIGIVDVGGGMRDIYGAGVLDFCMDCGIQFDHCVGVSAGSANLGAYLCRQRGRNYGFYTQYAFRREYMSLHNFLHTQSYIDMDYVYGTLCRSDGEAPLDYPAMAANPATLTVVATDARTGEPVYFDKNRVHQDDYDIFKASSCLPLVCRPYWVDGVPCFDGGLADPVPLEQAFAAGCDRVVLILTRPLDTRRSPKKDQPAARVLERLYPESAAALRLRWKKYNEGVDRAKALAAEGRVRILAPDDISGMSTLTKDPAVLDVLYRKGYRDARRALPAFLKEEIRD